MSYTDEGGSLKFLIDQFLSDLVYHIINVRVGFIENANSIDAKDRSDDKDQLTLAYTQVLTLFLNFKVKALVLVFLIFFDLKLVSNIFDFRLLQLFIKLARFGVGLSALLYGILIALFLGSEINYVS